MDVLLLDNFWCLRVPFFLCDGQVRTAKVLVELRMVLAFVHELRPQSLRKTVSSTYWESKQFEERTVTDSSCDADMKPNKTYAEELLQPA
jgi:hypothetical protein